MNFEKGDIIDANLEPTIGSETGKIRQCIIVTNNVYNKYLPVIQVVPITTWSEKKSNIKSNIELLPDKENGLTKKSIADCLQTRPIDIEKRFVNRRGHISKSTLQKIDEAIKIVFDLT